MTTSATVPSLPPSPPFREMLSDAEQRAIEQAHVSLAKRFCFCQPCSAERESQPGFLAGYLGVWS